jgi:hypothetical protein
LDFEAGRMKKRPADETPTESVPAPPPLPREALSEKALLLQLYDELKDVTFSLRSVARDLERVSETLAEHDRAWFTAMNFLEAQARATNSNGRADLIAAAIDKRTKDLAAAEKAHDEPTNPGGE